MKRSKRLAPILDLAEKKERDTALAFANQLKKVAEVRQGGENLHGFLNSYHDRYERTGSSVGFTVKQLAEYRVFLSKINGAIEDQGVTLQLVEAELEKYRRAWDEARQYRDGLVKLIQQANQEEQRLEAKQEQADMDERSARKAARSKSFAD